MARSYYMEFRFPIKDVKIRTTTVRRGINNPIYSDGMVNISQYEFSLYVEGVAWFYASNGNYVEVFPDEGAHQSTLELYLNGSVYGAILHQRGTLPLHGSCFKHKGMGIMICGESGMGKSSLTTAFCLKGADFLTDDVTPIVFKGDIPYIWAMSDRIKLHSDSLQQLNQSKETLNQVSPEWEKFYFPMQSNKGDISLLNHVFVLHIHNEPEVHFEPLKGVEKFAALRNEIYRSEYLQGMPASEAAYLKQLVTLSQRLTVTKVSRPVQILIEQLRSDMERHMLAAEEKHSNILVV